MSAVNDFVPFCSTDTGTNLLSQADYLADPQLVVGNQPGAARSKLVNKALRQATYLNSCFAQYLANTTGRDVLDDGTPSEILTTMAAAFKKTVSVQRFLSGSGTYTTPAGVSYLRVRMVGGGGGGGGSGVSGSNGSGSNGSSSTFGSSLLTATGGLGAASGTGGAGGSASVASPALKILEMTGAMGSSGQETTGTGQVFPFSGAGGSSIFAGAGASAMAASGFSAIANTGSGGGGGGGLESATNPNVAGGGGGAGAFIEAILNTPGATYSYSVGSGGSGGSAGSSGTPGGNGGSGVIIVEEHY